MSDFIGLKERLANPPDTSVTVGADGMPELTEEYIDSLLEKLGSSTPPEIKVAYYIANDGSLRPVQEYMLATIRAQRLNYEQQDKEDKVVLEALCFARSCIRSGEPWTETCERVIGGAIRSLKEKQGDYECVPGTQPQ